MTVKEFRKYLKKLYYALQELTPRERKVLQLRWGLYFKKPQRLVDVAPKVGMKSKEGVRRVEAKALKKVEELFND